MERTGDVRMGREMDRPLFSIIVVTLNPGEKLLRTIESIRGQICCDYQVVVKDGGSGDDSLTGLKALKERESCEAVQGNQADFWNRVEIYEEPDKSIYEGMNQATKYTKGRYLYFLNCGDYFYDEGVLERLKQEIGRLEREGRPAQTVQTGKAVSITPLIVYGDIYDALRDVRVASNPQIDGFGCYRNVPCHQACVYDAALFEERGYEAKYRVRGDYEHFLWSFYVKKARTVYIPMMIASYEGGGYSETAENRRRSAAEHKEITAKYMSPGQLFRYRAMLLLTLAPLRTRMAESPVMSGLYNRAKGLLYGRKK